MPGLPASALKCQASLFAHPLQAQQGKVVMHSLDSLIYGEAPVHLDVFALKDRLQGLFSRYGQVSRLDLVHADQGRGLRIMCFLRMSTPEQEQAVVDALGMGRFGGDLVMVLALGEPLPQAAWPATAPPALPATGWQRT